jgi:hypothetical protein
VLIEAVEMIVDAVRACRGHGKACRGRKRTRL